MEGGDQVDGLSRSRTSIGKATVLSAYRPYGPVSASGEPTGLYIIRGAFTCLRTAVVPGKVLGGGV